MEVTLGLAVADRLCGVVKQVLSREINSEVLVICVIV